MELCLVVLSQIIEPSLDVLQSKLFFCGMVKRCFSGILQCVSFGFARGGYGFSSSFQISGAGALRGWYLSFTESLKETSTGQGFVPISEELGFGVPDIFLDLLNVPLKTFYLKIQLVSESCQAFLLLLILDYCLQQCRDHFRNFQVKREVDC
jgi:hypothetical protein